MYSIIQKIYEKSNKILKEGVKKVLNGDDVSSLTSAIKDFTDVLEKELFSEIATQIENLVFEDAKRKNQYEAIRFADKSLITKNGKTKFERRYYKDKETGENVCLTDKVLGIDKVKTPRRELVDKFTFSGLYKDTQEMWEDVVYYIECTYKKEEIETIFVMGDGASYIKAGTEWIEKSVFVLDTFHLKKYINHLNCDEYLKTKLQEAIDQYDPISTESIMEEAIRKIEKEIKEDEELGRTTKRLENRLKK